MSMMFWPRQDYSHDISCDVAVFSSPRFFTNQSQHPVDLVGDRNASPRPPLIAPSGPSSPLLQTNTGASAQQTKAILLHEIRKPPYMAPSGPHWPFARPKIFRLRYLARLLIFCFDIRLKRLEIDRHQMGLAGGRPALK